MKLQFVKLQYALVVLFIIFFFFVVVFWKIGKSNGVLAF